MKGNDRYPSRVNLVNVKSESLWFPSFSERTIDNCNQLSEESYTSWNPFARVMTPRLHILAQTSIRYWRVRVITFMSRITLQFNNSRPEKE